MTALNFRHDSAQHLEGARGISGADDDDFLNADYYTSFRIWHQAIATGPLEAYLAFKFVTSTYSGQITDELGLSNATVNQWARSEFRVLAPDGIWDFQVSRMFNVLEVVWGGDVSWDNFVAAPNDIHWYYFRTSRSFTRGDQLLLEAGIRNLTWYTADDESVATADDLDLRLDRVLVRSRSSGLQVTLRP